jgi:hypothetical protein
MQNIMLLYYIIGAGAGAGAGVRGGAGWAHNQNLASELDELLLLFRPQNALQ